MVFKIICKWIKVQVIEYNVAILIDFLILVDNEGVFKVTKVSDLDIELKFNSVFHNHLNLLIGHALAFKSLHSFTTGGGEGSGLGNTGTVGDLF